MTVQLPVNPCSWAFWDCMEQDLSKVGRSEWLGLATAKYIERNFRRGIYYGLLL